MSDFVSNVGPNFFGGMLVVTLVAVIGWFWRWIKAELQPLQEIPLIVARQESVMRTQDIIVAEVATLSQNGGSSMRDSIDRNEVMTSAILKQVKK